MATIKIAAEGQTVAEVRGDLTKVLAELGGSDSLPLLDFIQACIDGNKIKAIKAVRAATGLDLKGAKGLVERIPAFTPRD